VLLERGASRLYAVDVGREQLHAKLRDDPRVVGLEGMDARGCRVDRETGRRRGGRCQFQGAGRDSQPSSVPKVIMVSCNPGTCARDLRILFDGGYHITRVVLVDQFLFSPHIELVAVLER
jgi:hypothetical protein